MASKDLFQSILNELPRIGAVILDTDYNDNVFGNFIISFTIDNSNKSLVCDRGEIYFCQDSEGSRDCMLVCSLHGTIEKDQVSDILKRIG